jgi:hypothetical protein
VQHENECRLGLEQVPLQRVPVHQQRVLCCVPPSGFLENVK